MLACLVILSLFASCLNTCVSETLCVACDISRRYNFMANSLSLWLIQFSIFSSSTVSEIWVWKLFYKCVQLGLGFTTLQFCWLCFSVRVYVICCKENFHWWGVIGTMANIENIVRDYVGLLKHSCSFSSKNYDIITKEKTI